MRIFLLTVAVVTVLLAAPTWADDLYFTPYDKDAAEKRLIEIVQRSNNRIRVCAYAFSDKLLAKALIAARSRGVDVEIIMDKSQSSLRHQKVLIHEFRSAGVSVTVGRSAKKKLIHSKFIIADDMLEDGSFNFSGQTAGGQCNVLRFTSERNQIQKYSEFWEKIKRDAHE